MYTLGVISYSFQKRITAVNSHEHILNELGPDLPEPSTLHKTQSLGGILLCNHSVIYW